MPQSPSAKQRALERQVEALGISRIERHIFLCCDQSKPKCSPRQQSLESWAFLKTRLEELGLVGGGGVDRARRRSHAGGQGDPRCRRTASIDLHTRSASPR